MVLKWKALLELGQAILITGHKREGKSALAWFLLYLANQLFKIPCYVIGVPEEKWVHFPGFAEGLILDADMDLPEHAAIFIEEAALIFYAREHGKDLNKMVSKILGATGQKGQIVVFATHHTRKLDVNVVLDMDIWALKRPTKWHVRFERRELRSIVKEAYEDFQEVQRASDESYELAIVWGIDYERVPVNNPLPYFWSRELSNVFEGVSLVDQSKETKQTVSTKYPMNAKLQIFGERTVRPRDMPLTKEELNTAEKYLRRAVSQISKGKVPETLALIEEAQDALTGPPEGIMSSPRSPLTDAEEKEIAAVLARWTIFEDKVGEGKSALPTMAWVTPILEHGAELSEGQEADVKRQAVYVKGGLSVHYKEPVHDEVHAIVAKQVGAKPEDFYDSSQPSFLEGYDGYYAFDLTRRSVKKNWMAAGGRITPTEFIKDLQEVDSDQIAVVIDPVYAEALA